MSLGLGRPYSLLQYSSLSQISSSSSSSSSYSQYLHKGKSTRKRLKSSPADYFHRVDSCDGHGTFNNMNLILLLGVSLFPILQPTETAVQGASELTQQKKSRTNIKKAQCDDSSANPFKFILNGASIFYTYLLETLRSLVQLRKKMVETTTKLKKIKCEDMEVDTVKMEESLEAEQTERLIKAEVEQQDCTGKLYSVDNTRMGLERKLENDEKLIGDQLMSKFNSTKSNLMNKKTMKETSSLREKLKKRADLSENLEENLDGLLDEDDELSKALAKVDNFPVLQEWYNGQQSENNLNSDEKEVELVNLLKDEIVAKLVHERDWLKKLLDTKLEDVKNLKEELQSTKGTLGNSQNEVLVLQKQRKQPKEPLQKTLHDSKQYNQEIAVELAMVKKVLGKTSEELQNVTHELKTTGRNYDGLENQMVEVCRRAELMAKELSEEKHMVSSLTSILKAVEKQMEEEREVKKSLEIDLEEATGSLDNLNRSALELARELEKASIHIYSLENEKLVLYKSFVEERNNSQKARRDLEDACDLAMRIGKERDAFEKRAQKLEDEMATAKGEILPWRNLLHSSHDFVNGQNLQQRKMLQKS